MVYYAYIVRSAATGRFYIGHTASLSKRIAEHNNNRTSSIKNREPWELVYKEEYARRGEANRRERQIKRRTSHRWIEQVVRASR
jgi:putative endonuclease